VEGLRSNVLRYSDSVTSLVTSEMQVWREPYTTLGCLRKTRYGRAEFTDLVEFEKPVADPRVVLSGTVCVVVSGVCCRNADDVDFLILWHERRQRQW
jgi:hypothetical protein